MEIKAKLKNIVQELKIKDKIELFFLFGSQARGDSNQNSDIDLAILLEEYYYQKINPLNLRSELIAYFTSELGNECDVVLINQANHLLKYQIIKYGEIIYQADSMRYSTFFSRIVREHLDFRYYKQLHNKLLLKRINGDGDS